MVFVGSGGGVAFACENAGIDGTVGRESSFTGINPELPSKPLIFAAGIHGPVPFRMLSLGCSSLFRAMARN